MTLPIIMPENLMHFIPYIHENLRKYCVFFKTKYRFITLRKLTKQFQPDLFDDSEHLHNRLKCFTMNDCNYAECIPVVAHYLINLLRPVYAMCNITNLFFNRYR